MRPQPNNHISLIPIPMHQHHFLGVRTVLSWKHHIFLCLFIIIMFHFSFLFYSLWLPPFHLPLSIMSVFGLSLACRSLYLLYRPRLSTDCLFLCGCLSTFHFLWNFSLLHHRFFPHPATIFQFLIRSSCTTLFTICLSETVLVSSSSPPLPVSTRPFVSPSINAVTLSLLSLFPPALLPKTGNQRKTHYQTRFKHSSVERMLPCNRPSQPQICPFCSHSLPCSSSSH